MSQVLLNFISLIPQKSPLRLSWCYRRVGGLRERQELQGPELSAGSVSHLVPLLPSALGPVGSAAHLAVSSHLPILGQFIVK